MICAAATWTVSCLTLTSAPIILRTAVTYSLLLIPILLTLLAAAQLVFMTRNAWPPHRRAVAGAVLISLFATEGAGFAGLGDSAGTIAIIIAAAIVSLTLAQFTAGLFRWITSLTAIALMLWWIFILAFLTAGPGFR